MFDICVVGHITSEIVRTPRTERQMLGGAAYYSAVALHNLGWDVSVITKLHPRDRSLLSEFENQKITVFHSESPTTTSFLNVYGDDGDGREQWVRAVALPFDVDDVADADAGLFHLGPLTKDEISLPVIRYISKRASVSLDAQGFVRTVVEADEGWNKIGISKWQERERILPFITILKVNEEEARTLSDRRDLKDLAAELSSLGPEEVIITRGSRPSLIHSGGRSHWIETFQPREFVDATGAGDTFMAGYLFYRQKTDSVEEAGKFAAMTASLKLGHHGPFVGTEQDVRDFAEEVGDPLPSLS